MDIAVVAGEVSGDQLGAALLRELRRLYPQARFLGIGGERMRVEGLESLYPLEALSVMGLAEVIRHLPELLRIRRALYRRFRTVKPAVFIGIDYTEFNLGLERRLRAAGVPTVHYVSPQIWAWRRGRVRTMADTADLLLTLLPFEAEFYRAHTVPVRYVGHPLADEISLQTDTTAARRALALAPASAPLLALLPGSRRFEVELLLPLFLDVARALIQHHPQLSCIVPAANANLHDRIAAIIGERAPELPIRLIIGQARAAMTAADAVLLSSGTATLEALLLKRPMVVVYKMAPLSAWVARRLVKVEHFALPNLLAGARIVPEFFQEVATVGAVTSAMSTLLGDDGQRSRLQQAFTAIHQTLRRDASRQAAAAIAELIAARPLAAGPHAA